MNGTQLRAIFVLFDLWGRDKGTYILEKKEEALSSWEENNEDATLTRVDVEGVFVFLCNYDWKVILCDFCMSENHLGGDDMIFVVDSVLEAIKDGYHIHTWYGDNAEVLIFGMKMEDTSCMRALES